MCIQGDSGEIVQSKHCDKGGQVIYSNKLFDYCGSYTPSKSFKHRVILKP